MKTVAITAATFLSRIFLFLCAAAHSAQGVTPQDKASLLSSLFGCVGTCSKMHTMIASGLEVNGEQYCEAGPFMQGTGHSCNFDTWDVSKVKIMSVGE